MNDSNEPLRKPVRDIIWAYRALLVRDKGKPKDVPLPLREAKTLASQIYPYTKGPDYTNDTLAYGERVLEENSYLTDRDLIVQWRVSRRTRSGRRLEGVIKKLGVSTVGPAAAWPDEKAESEEKVRVTESQAPPPSRSPSSSPEPAPAQMAEPPPNVRQDTSAT